ncbi:MAG: ATP-binding protein [Thermodesulfobacteriota bacterium]|nr:ATP-binding protein [Thermodesulfobacteriota bacterium]
MLRELLLNAIIHKDYRDPTDVIIKMFDEHVEFTSPGGLFGGLRLEALYTDFYRASHRNKLLAEAFYLTGEVEKYGTGFIRIRNQLREESPDMALRLDSDSGAFHVLIGLVPGISRKTSEKTSEKTTEKTTEKIIELLKGDPYLTIDRLAEQSGVTTRSIERSLKKLQETRKLKRIGPNKGGHWEVQ